MRIAPLPLSTAHDQPVASVSLRLITVDGDGPLLDAFTLWPGETYAQPEATGNLITDLVTLAHSVARGLGPIVELRYCQRLRWGGELERVLEVTERDVRSALPRVWTYSELQARAARERKRAEVEASQRRHDDNSDRTILAQCVVAPDVRGVFADARGAHR